MKRWTVPVLILLVWFAGSTALADHPEPVTIQVAVGAVGTELELHRTALQRFMEQHPNVQVELVETPEGANNRLGLYLQFFEAQSPEIDVLQVDVIWPGILQEHLVDLYEHGAGEVEDQYFAGSIQNNVVDGRLVAIPYQIGAGLLYYRTDLLEKYGYDAPPATWDELEEMARTIQEGERTEGNPDMWGFAWQGNAYEGLTCNALEWISSSGGGTFISPDGTITVYNDAAADILEQAAGWVGSISPTGVTSYVEDDARNLFQAGNAVFMRNWPYAYNAGQSEGSAIRGLFDVTVLPAGGPEGTNAACLGGQSLAVSRYSENPDVAADVALYLASEEVQRLRAIEGSFSGTIASLYEDPDVLAVNPFFARLMDVFAAAVPRPSTATGEEYSAVSRAIYTSVHDVLTGRRDVDTALALLEMELESITGFPTGQPNQ